MADSFSVKAILSATDSGFSSTLKSCSSTLDKLGDKISGFSFGLLSGAGQAAFSAITNGISDMVGEIDASSKAWKTFEGNMDVLGKTEKEINDVKGTLQKYATETIYSASDMATAYSQLAAVGIDSADELITGFGGLAAAAENPAQAMKTLSQQGVQMAAKPTVAWQDFKLMLEQTPAGMARVAAAMGMTASELVTAVQDGKVKTEDFFEAVKKVGNVEFGDLARQYKSVGDAADGLKETVGNKLLSAFDVLSEKGITVISGIIDKFDEIDGEKIAGAVTTLLDRIEDFGTKAKLYIDAAREAFDGVGSAVGEAMSAIRNSMNDTFGSAESVDGFKGAMEGVAEIIKKVAAFATEHSDAIATLITSLPKIAIAIKGFQIAKTVAPFVTTFATSIGKLAGKGIGGIASKLFGISKSQTTVGTTSATSGAQMLTAAKSYALMGVAVLAIALGFAILAQSAIALSNAGGLAIGVMAGMVLAVVGLGIGMAALLKSLAPMAGQLMPVATAFLAMGAAVVLIAVGFAILAAASIALANAGWGAIAVMVGMVAVIALLAVGAAALAPALTAGAVGFIAFGAALLIVAVAAVVGAAALAIVSSVLPTISEYGLTGATAIAALGAAMIVFAAGAALAGAAAVVLGAGLVVLAAGTVAADIAVIAFGISMAAAAVGVGVMAVALKAVGSSMKTIASNAKKTAKSLEDMQDSVSAVESGLDALGSKAKSAMKSIGDAFDDTANEAKSAGQKVGSNFDNGMQPGLQSATNSIKTSGNLIVTTMNMTAAQAKISGQNTGSGYATGIQVGMVLAVSAARSGVSSVTATLNTGYGGAYSAGAYIGAGFANGMLSYLGKIRSAAAQMVEAAESAVTYAAQIASPSKLFFGLGEYTGEGYADGIEAMTSSVSKVANDLVAIPKVAAADFAGSYNGELSADYDYYRNAEYVIVVPVNIDGRETAKVIAPYTQSELNKQQIRSQRKLGKV